MKTILLTGRLGKLFGKSFKLDVVSPAEAVRALCYMVAGFEDELRKGAYRVIRVFPDGTQLGHTENDLGFEFGSAGTLRIEPVIKGSKSGLWSIILGVVLVGAAFLFTGGALSGVAFTAFGTAVTGTQIALVGGLMALSGVSSMITASYAQTPGSDDEKTSFMINTPNNRGEQGHPIPYIAGECFVGSIVASNGLTVEDFEAED